jgi:signal peptidase
MENKESKIKISFRFFGKLIYWLILCVLLLIAGLVALSSINIPGGIKLYTVQSGSMEPTILTGSIIISKSSDNYQKGDIITFKAEKDRTVENPKYITTHRIYEIKTDNNKEEYVTKGDANNAPDLEPASKDLVLGKTLFSIPYFGYPVSYAKTREGLLLLVILPAVIIIFSEMISIRDEAKRLLEERKKRKLTLTEKIEVEIGEEEIKAEKWYRKLISNFKLFFKR